MAKYKTLSPLKHNGTHYKVGRLVELPDDQAEPLVILGVVELPKAKGKAAVDADAADTGADGEG